MSAHLSQQELEQYHRSALPPMDLLAADDHLAACGQCREQLVELMPEAQAWQTLRASLPAEGEQPEHLSYEQLAAYVDEKLNGIQREAVESHLEICRMCDAELQDLRAFSLEIKATPVEQSPAPSASVAAIRAWRRQWMESLTMRWPVLAGAAALLLLIAALLYFRLRVGQESPPNIATVSPTPVMSSPSPMIIEGGTPTSMVTLNDGGRTVTLDREGRLITHQPLPPAYERMIKRALTTGRVETPNIVGLNVKTGSLMGGGENAPFQLLEPIAKVIESNQPVFRWQPLAGATSYTLTVYNADFNRVKTSPLLTGTEWRPPQPLPRGAIYSWQVKASKDGQEVIVPEPPAPEAKFKVLERARAEELAQARQQFASSHLTLGLLYARAGMQDEAAKELQSLLDANQGSPLARKLLRSVTPSSR
jgi:predicted anti-sigma-YlaC factor YlaD